ncbi:hypothetical protein HDE78_003927 [Rhodanobacter sp. K2T2]|uniref:hypothetical protein n=1 Tax=Rhodanobacter sp. K2T2 TaxID=2723085 RepID=UPI0015CCC6DB|nr:hypothetical protein [Rhodanobacter sp. K2T2]NYE30950.1 hypothetical protein [Rhodanobacter sp. K2T2]
MPLQWWSRKKSGSNKNSSVGKITNKLLREAIRAGIGAQVLSQTVQSFYDQSKIIYDPARRAKAEQDAHNILNHSVTGPVLQQRIEDQTDQYTDWIKLNRCEKEGFATKVAVHMCATLALVGIGFAILFFVGIFSRVRPASELSRTADAMARAFVNTIAPETGSENSSSAPANSSSAPAPPKKGLGN